MTEAHLVAGKTIINFRSIQTSDILDLIAGDTSLKYLVILDSLNQGVQYMYQTILMECLVMLDRSHCHKNQ